jgi:hypothetical protein
LTRKILKNEFIKFVNKNVARGEKSAFESEEGILENIRRKEEMTGVFEITDAIYHLKRCLGLMVIVSNVIDKLGVFGVVFRTMWISKGMNGKEGPEEGRFDRCFEGGCMSWRFNDGWNLMEVPEANEGYSTERSRALFYLTTYVITTFNCTFICCGKFFPYDSGSFIDKVSAM